MSPEYTSKEIQQRMNALRSSLSEDVVQVASGVRAKTDWRYYVQNHIWLVVGATATVGYLCVPRRVEKVTETVPDADALARLVKQEKLVMAPKSRIRPEKGGLMSTITALALAAGSRAAMGYVSNQLGSMLNKSASREEEPLPHVYAGPKPK